MRKLLLASAITVLSTTSYAELIDFTGGIAVRNDGSTYVTDSTAHDFEGIDYYSEAGFRFDFIDPSEDPFNTSVGNYFNNGSDVFHGHADSWSNGLDEIRVYAVNGSNFTADSFRLTTHAGESWSVNAIDTSGNVIGSQSLPQEGWGVGGGSDPIINLDQSIFNNVSAISFTASNSAFGLGFDDFNFIQQSVAEKPREDLEEVIQKIYGSQTFNASFQTSDQSMWGTGEAIVIDKQFTIGPEFEKTFSESYANGLLKVDASANFFAQLNANFYLNSGDVDVDWSSDISTDYTVNSDGSIDLNFDYLPTSTLFSTHSPDANMEVTFDYGLGASFSASIDAPGSAFDTNIIDPVDFHLRTFKDENGYTVNIDDVSYDEDNNPVDSEGNPLVLTDDAKIAIVPYTSIYGDNSWSVFDGKYGSMSINQPTGPIVTEDDSFEDGISTRGLSDKPIVQATIDLDALAVDLVSKATGVPVPAGILGGKYGDPDLEDSFYSFSYEMLDVNLNAALNLFQEFEFTPELYVRVAADTGEVHSGKVGENSLNFEAKDDGSALEFTSTYWLDHPDSPSILSNSSGLNGTLDLNVVIGHLNLDVDIPDFLWPDDVDRPFEATLWSPEPSDLADFDMSIFDSTFSIEGFNSFEQNFSVDSYSVNFFAVDEIISQQLPSDTLDNEEEWLVDGTSYFNEDGKMVIKTNSPTLVYADISIPTDALLFSLDYIGVDIHVDDIFSIMFDDDILFSIFGSMIDDEWMRTSLFDISQYAGQDILLTISLLSPEGVHSELLVDNMAFYNQETEMVLKVEVPEPATIFIIAIGLLGLGLRKDRHPNA